MRGQFELENHHFRSTRNKLNALTLTDSLVRIYSWMQLYDNNDVVEVELQQRGNNCHFRHLQVVATTYEQVELQNRSEGFTYHPDLIWDVPSKWLHWNFILELSDLHPDSILEDTNTGRKLLLDAYMGETTMPFMLNVKLFSKAY